MSGNYDLKRKKHQVFLLTYHIVLVTKFRKKCLTHEILEFLKVNIVKFCEEVKIECIEINGEEDHIHLLISITPQDTISSLIASLKCKTASLVHDNFKNLPYWGRHKRTLWSSGYFVVTCGGAPLSIIKQYIENQGR